MSHFEQKWGLSIRRRAPETEIRAIVDVVNKLTASGLVSRAAIIVACAQILAQNITGAPPDVAPEIRAGILALVDGFAMQSATEEP